MDARIASLTYHEVKPDQATSGFQRPGARRYACTPARFAAHLDVIAESPVAPSLVTDVAADRALLLTFDDGGRSALYAADQLERRGWRGHFFVVTGRIGGRTFLDRAGVCELRRRGHLVGTHSHTHPDVFRALSPAAMLAEWRVSGEALSDLLGEACLAGAVPGGDSSPAVFAAAARAGLRFLFTSEPSLVPRAVAGCWIVGRFAVRAGTSPERIRALTRHRGWRAAALVRRLKLAARAIAPPLYRWYVERTTAPTTPSAAFGPRARRAHVTDRRDR
ncbi:MAG TPA: polysaccharide deacetylase family protein [Gemmatimonadales bacterium]